jgi:hypothetical protein
MDIRKNLNSFYNTQSGISIIYTLLLNIINYQLVYEGGYLKPLSGDETEEDNKIRMCMILNQTLIKEIKNFHSRLCVNHYTEFKAYQYFENIKSIVSRLIPILKKDTWSENGTINVCHKTYLLCTPTIYITTVWEKNPIEKKDFLIYVCLSVSVRKGILNLFIGKTILFLLNDEYLYMIQKFNFDFLETIVHNNYEKSLYLLLDVLFHNNRDYYDI